VTVPARRPGEELIIAAAVDVMHKHGYHGSSIRDIADRAGLSTAALYHYFTSKQEILAAFMVRATDRHLEALVRSAEGLDGPAAQLAAVVREHVQLHVDHPVESFVGNTELRSLEPSWLATVIEKRDRIQRIFDDIVHQGVEEQVFLTRDPREASRAIVVMGTAIPAWYRPGGPLGPDDLGEVHVSLALALLECVPKVRRKVEAQRSSALS
jgi:AcrR family transcriptional regulator